MSAQLVIQFSPESTYTFDVSFTCTVSEVRQHISRVSKIPIDKFKLVNDGVALPDHLTLEQCQIQDFSRFYIMKSDSYMVNVRDYYRGNMIAIIVNPRDTIMAIKNKISKKENAPLTHISLMNQGRYLENEKTAKESGITENSTITMSIAGRY